MWVVDVGCRSGSSTTGWQRGHGIDVVLLLFDDDDDDNDDDDNDDDDDDVECKNARTQECKNNDDDDERKNDDNDDNDDKEEDQPQRGVGEGSAAWPGKGGG